MTEESASDLIDRKIAGLGGWRGETLAKLRALIREADPAVVEQVKWRKPNNPAGVPGACRDRLHRRNLQERGETDLRQRCFAG
jgi:hypothetical protein